MGIRKAKINEGKEFSSLYEDILWESFDYWSGSFKKNAVKNWTKEKIEGRIKRDDYLVIVAEEGGQLIGYLAAIIKNNLSFVRWMGVKRDYQGQGIGSKLIRYWEDWARKKGVTRLRLSTYLKENVGLYEKLRYKVRETQEKKVGAKYILLKEIDNV